MWRKLPSGLTLVLVILAACIRPARSIISRPTIDPRELIGTAKDEAAGDFPGDEFHIFLSRPDIKAPKFRVNVFDRKALAPGYWFVAPYHDLAQAGNAKAWVGPYIYDDTGELIWCGAPLFDHFNTFDFRPSRYRGEDVLTVMWPEHETGVTFDSGYQIVNRVNMTGMDMHEFNLIEDGTRALTVTSTEHKSIIEQAAAIGFGHNQTCQSLWKGFKEVDTATSQPVFEWDGRDHIGLDEVTFVSDDYDVLCHRNWDILHFNAVDKFPDGDYLLSARHTDTLYKVSHIDGSTVWRLGGTKSDFKFATPDVKFSRQHHATVRLHNSTSSVVGMFDNAIGTGANAEPSHANSRGLMLALDHQTMTASVIAQYDHPDGALTNSRGSFQSLSNGNAFMGWTYHTQLSEHTVDGKLILEASLKRPSHSYRSYKFPWVGRPAQEPDVFSSTSSSVQGNQTHAISTVVYVSWNGATEVVSWNLYHSDISGATTELIVTTQRQGFETVLVFEGYARYVVAEALDANGHPLGRSAVVETVAPGVKSEEWSEAVVAEALWLQEQAPPTFTDVVEAVASNPFAAFASFAAGVLVSLLVLALAWLAWTGRRKVFGLWKRDEEGEKGVYEPLCHDGTDGRRASFGESREDIQSEV